MSTETVKNVVKSYQVCTIKTGHIMYGHFRIDTPEDVKEFNSQMAWYRSLKQNGSAKYRVTITN